MYYTLSIDGDLSQVTYKLGMQLYFILRKLSPKDG